MIEIKGNIGKSMIIECLQLSEYTSVVVSTEFLPFTHLLIPDPTYENIKTFIDFTVTAIRAKKIYHPDWVKLEFFIFYTNEFILESFREIMTRIEIDCREQVRYFIFCHK